MRSLLLLVCLGVVVIPQLQAKTGTNYKKQGYARHYLARPMPLNKRYRAQRVQRASKDRWYNYRRGNTDNISHARYIRHTRQHHVLRKTIQYRYKMARYAGYHPYHYGYWRKQRKQPAARLVTSRRDPAKRDRSRINPALRDTRLKGVQGSKPLNPAYQHSNIPIL
jgi:hypothetical protein